MTATLSILFAGATKESGRLLGFHVSLTIFLILRFLWLVATRLANRGGNNA
jgi:hypothetical protein